MKESNKKVVEAGVSEASHQVGKSGKYGWSVFMHIFWWGGYWRCPMLFSLLMPLMALQMRLMMLLPPLLMPNHDTLAPLGAACAKVGAYKSCNRDTWQDAPTHQHLPGHFLAICNPWGSSWASPGGVITFKFISRPFLDACWILLPSSHIFKVLFQVVCRIFELFIKHNLLKTNT